MNAKTEKKLRSIVSPIYKKWKPKLFRYEYTAPDIRQAAIDKARNPQLPEYVRQRYQNMVDAGEFDAQELVIDQKAAEQYEKAVERAVQEAIKTGVLPKPKTPEIMNKLMDKSKQHAKRTIEREKPNE